MARYNILLTGYSIADEIITRTGSTALRIGHDLIVGTGFEIWTGAGKTGTKLTLTTDYVLSAQNTYYSGATQANTPIWTKLAIVNGAYQNMTLYLTYTTIGDLNSTENVAEVVSNACTIITAAYSALKTDTRIVVNTASAITITLPTGCDLYKRIIISRPVTSTYAITAATSGSETIEGATTFVTHGATVSTTLNLQEIVLEKITSTTWRFVAGIVSGNNANGYWKTYPNRELRCWRKNTLIDVADQPYNAFGSTSGYTHHGISTFTFPATFASMPQMLSNPGSTGMALVTKASALSTTTYNLQWFDSNGSVIQHGVDWEAIGERA